MPLGGGGGGAVTAVISLPEQTAHSAQWEKRVDTACRRVTKRLKGIRGGRRLVFPAFYFVNDIGLLPLLELVVYQRDGLDPEVALPLELSNSSLEATICPWTTTTVGAF